MQGGDMLIERGGGLRDRTYRIKTHRTSRDRRHRARHLPHVLYSRRDVRPPRDEPELPFGRLHPSDERPRWPMHLNDRAQRRVTGSRLLGHVHLLCGALLRPPIQQQINRVVISRSAV